MPIVNRIGGGAGGFNCKVVQYAAAPTETDTAAENTIAVITSTEITSWCAANTEPAGTVGGVWLDVSAAAEADIAFFADKRRFFYLSPGSVKQYINGVWLEMPAYIYQDSVWVKFCSPMLVLYSPGDMHESVTGGYVTGKGNGGSVNFGADSFRLTAVSNSVYSSWAKATTTNYIDVTNYSKLIVDCAITETGNGKAIFSWYIQDEAGNQTASTSTSVNITGPLELDVSSATGPHMVCFAAQGYYEQSYGSMTIYNVYFC